MTPVQTAKDPAKKVNQQQATTRTMATTATASKPAFRKLTDDEKAWVNEFDDVSGCLLLASISCLLLASISICLLFSHLERDVPSCCSIIQLLVDVSFWCDS